MCIRMSTIWARDERKATFLSGISGHWGWILFGAKDTQELFLLLCLRRCTAVSGAG